ncbi:DoxX family protein [Janibacter sp. G1551]|uniref:DoxX family protein n=1 Tax=Janibacter sp. G1551 TaxID=3420440 RepID=UPI003D029D53
MLIRRLARLALAGIFISGGLDSLKHPQSKKAMAEPVVQRLAGPLGLPQDTELLVRANAATMLAGGSLLALGHLPRLASTVLVGAMIPTTATHDFWAQTDPAEKKKQRTQFLKNVAIIGGLTLAALDTEGKPGLTYRAKLAGRSADRTVSTTRREARHAARAARREARLAAAHAKHAFS